MRARARVRESARDDGAQAAAHALRGEHPTDEVAVCAVHESLEQRAREAALLGGVELDGGRELLVVAREDGPPALEERDPALALFGHAGLVDDDQVKHIVGEHLGRGADGGGEDHLPGLHDALDQDPLAGADLAPGRADLRAEAALRLLGGAAQALPQRRQLGLRVGHHVGPVAALEHGLE